MLLFRLDSLITIQHGNVQGLVAARPLAMIIDSVLKMIVTNTWPASNVSDPAPLPKQR